MRSTHTRRQTPRAFGKKLRMRTVRSANDLPESWPMDKETATAYHRAYERFPDGFPS